MCKGFKIIFAVIVFTVLFLSCKRKPVDAHNQVKWISEDPLTIPYWVRQQKFDKGNLVRNCSFESGKNIVVDSAGITFRIDGWEKIGNNVQWVNADNDDGFQKDEAFDSIRAVKIIRNHSDETDELGEGIMSDYIKVIPGNYMLSLYIRLENINSALERYGIPLYDAVNIRLLCYDKNKIKISSRKYDPANKVFIDNSFKSLSSAAFWQISKLPWSWMIGKSINSPLFDGDIPADTRYVKIFLGLRGTGTMWIDLVDFRYTKSNFSTLERMQKLMDTTLLKQEILVPYPKKIIKVESLTYFKQGGKSSNLPIIVIPVDAGFETKEAAKLLKKRIEFLLHTSGDTDKKIEVVTDIPENITKSSRIIFSVGKNNLYRRFREILPLNSIKNKNQGYFIYTSGDLSNIIFLCGNAPVGDYYAVTTAIQLFDTKKYIFHNAIISDYPDLPGRFIRADSLPDGYFNSNNFDPFSLAVYKINGLNVNINNKSFETKNIKNTENKILKTFLLYSFDHEKEYRKISVKNIFELPDWDNIDPAKSVSSDYIYLPVWSDNENMNKSYGKAENYFKNIDKDVSIYWNGSSELSQNTDHLDLFRIISETGSKPVWWDNSMEVYKNMVETEIPYKKDLYNIFEPFNNSNVKYLLNLLDSSLFFVNLSINSELDMIKMAVVADFMWNTYSFDQDLSLWRVLRLRYGKGCARELILFNNDYVSLMKINAGLKDPAHLQRYFRKGENLKIVLPSRIEKIERFIGKNHPLVVELKRKTDALLMEFKKYEVNALNE